MILVLFAVAFCLLVPGLFSGIEAGIMSINRARLRYQVKLRDKNAIKLERLLAHPERLLATVLLVTNLMNICAVAISTRALVRGLGVYGYAVAFIIWLPVYLGVALLPKSIFRRFPIARWCLSRSCCGWFTGSCRRCSASAPRSTICFPPGRSTASKSPRGA